MREKKGKYKKRVTVGYDYEGKQVQKWVYADTKYELDRKVRDAHYALTSRLPFKKYATKWFETYKIHNAYETRSAYERIINSKCDYISDLYLEDIKRSDIQHIINENADSPQMCRKIRTTLNQIFTLALGEGLVAFNPVDGITLPKAKTVKRRVLTDEEKTNLSDADLSPSDMMYAKCLYYFGLRPAEALALRSESFNFALETVCIDSAIEFSTPPHLKGTKTDSVRILPIPTAFASELQDYCKDKDFLFLMKNGNIYSKTGAKRKWERIKKAISPGSDLHPYVFRYSYATRLYYSGISIKKAAYLMGHSNVNMILKIYAQLDDENEKIEVLKKDSI